MGDVKPKQLLSDMIIGGTAAFFGTVASGGDVTVGLALGGSYAISRARDYIRGK